MTILAVPKESKRLSAAYNTIKEFFDCYKLPEARRCLNQMLKAAYSEKPTKEHPANVLYFNEQMEGLAIAALQFPDRKAAAGDTVPDVHHTGSYYPPSKWYLPWDYVPRFLTAKEFADPYIVFKKLHRYGNKKQWRFIFHELRDYSFHKASFTESAEEYNPIKLYLLLHKLLEAAHLVQLRGVWASQ